MKSDSALLENDPHGENIYIEPPFSHFYRNLIDVKSYSALMKHVCYGIEKMIHQRVIRLQN